MEVGFLPLFSKRGFTETQLSSGHPPPSMKKAPTSQQSLSPAYTSQLSSEQLMFFNLQVLIFGRNGENGEEGTHTENQVEVLVTDWMGKSRKQEKGEGVKNDNQILIKMAGNGNARNYIKIVQEGTGSEQLKVWSPFG